MAERQLLVHPQTCDCRVGLVARESGYLQGGERQVWGSVGAAPCTNTMRKLQVVVRGRLGPARDVRSSADLTMPSGVLFYWPEIHIQDSAETAETCGALGLLTLLCVHVGTSDTASGRARAYQERLQSSGEQGEVERICFVQPGGEKTLGRRGTAKSSYPVPTWRSVRK